MNYKDIQNKIFYFTSQILNRFKPSRSFKKNGPIKMYSENRKKPLLSFKSSQMEIQAVPQGLRLVVSSKRSPQTPVLEVLGLQESPNTIELVQDDIENCKIYGASASPLALKLNRDNGEFQILQNDKLLLDHGNIAQAGSWFQMKMIFPETVNWLGLGEKTGRLYKNPGYWRIWNIDECDMDSQKDPLYQAAPFILGIDRNGQSIGLYFDNPGYSDFRFNGQELEYRCETGPLSLYILQGPDLKSLCSQLAEIKGFAPLPPYWALGYHHSRWEPNESEGLVSETVAKFKKHNVPLDVVHLDIGHMDDFRCFTWDPHRFKDPASLISKLSDEKVRVIVISDPGLKSDKNWNVFRTALEQRFLCENKGGRTLYGEVWPGRISLVDFFKADARKFWGDLYTDYLAQGVSGFWIDMNEPSLFSPRRTLGPGCFHQSDNGKIPHNIVHNLYGHMMAKATFEGLKKLAPEKRPFILSRSAFMGTEKYAATWTGDNKSQWEHLRMSVPMMLNMGLSGQAMTGPDIGGFFEDTHKELFIRWMELGRFYPFCRNHRCAGTRSQDPWSFDEETLEAFKHCLGIRYSLLPYFYTAFYQASKQGVPVMQPLFMEFPQDKMLYEQQIAETEFLLGESLLIAPILGPGQTERAFYLPRDTYWFNYYSNEFLQGGRIHSVKAPFGRTPFFVKAGTALFQTPPCVSSEDSLKAPLLCNIYPAKQIRGFLYLDSGDGYGYKKGEYSLIQINGELTEYSLDFAIEKIGGVQGYPVLGEHEVLKLYIPDPYGPSIVDVRWSDGALSKDKLKYEQQGKYLVIFLKPENFPAHLTCSLS